MVSGWPRLIIKSIQFGTRSRRRFFTFWIMFSVLSGFTILLLNQWEQYGTELQIGH